MGMFDSVIFICPDCGESVEFQTKVGACVLRRYSYEDVPPEIAKDIEGSWEACPKCGKKIKIKASSPIQNITMRIKAPFEEEDDE